MNHDCLTIFNRHMCFAQHSHRKHPNASFYHLSNMNLLAQGSIGRMFFKLFVFLDVCFVSCHIQPQQAMIVGYCWQAHATLGHTPLLVAREAKQDTPTSLSTRLLNLGQQQTGQHLRACMRCKVLGLVSILGTHAITCQVIPSDELFLSFCGSM